MLKKSYLIYNLAAIAVLWIGWLIAYRIVQNDYIFPSLGDTLAKVGELLTDSAFWSAFFNTVYRSVCAFLMALAGAIVPAVLAGMFPSVKRFFKPFITVIRTVPTMAFILLLLVWTTPKQAPVIVAVTVILPTLYSGILTAIENVDPKLVEMSKVYNVPIRERIVRMYLPIASPYILSEMGASISLTLKLMVSAEVLSKTFQSIGGMMQEAKMYAEVPTMMALTVVIVLTGVLLEAAFELLAVLIQRWKR